MNEIFHILMCKCILKPIHHTQTPKIPRASPMNLFASLLTIKYRSLPNWQNIQKSQYCRLLNNTLTVQMGPSCENIPRLTLMSRDLQNTALRKLRFGRKIALNFSSFCVTITDLYHLSKKVMADF